MGPRSQRMSGHAAFGVCCVDVFRARPYMFEQFGVDAKLYVELIMS